MITLNPNPLLATGRVSYSGPVQLLPRDVSKHLAAALAGSGLAGVRDCIKARDGYGLGSCDYEAGELVTHAQSLLWMVGHSKLAEALLNGTKPHNLLAATMTGMTYDEFNTILDAGDKHTKNSRQAAKPGNFGFPGGMGIMTLVLAQRKQGPDTVAANGRRYKGLRFCILMDGATECGKAKVTEYKGKACPPVCEGCLDAATRLKAFWLRTFPENSDYFASISEQVKRDEDNPHVYQHVDNRKRGGVGFCAAANGYFQALLALAAKKALCRVSLECYTDRKSVLYGSRPILFAHDEIIAEHPLSVAAEACERVSTIMVEELQRTCPDLAPACKAEPTLMHRWYKNAACVRDGAGKLQFWEP